MFKLFIIFLIIIIILIFLCSDNNPYQLIMLFGKKGSGKTTLIAKLSIKYNALGYKVYSNVVIPNTYYYDPKEIGLKTFPKNSVVFCDEVGLIWNNRDYKNFRSCVREWFKYQRQYKIRMYLFSQAFDVDKVLRDLTDKMYYIKRLGKLSLARPIYKNFGLATDENGNGTMVDSYSAGGLFSIKFTYLPRYYGLFNSFNPPELDLINGSYQPVNDDYVIFTKNYYWLHNKFLFLKYRIWYFIIERFNSSCLKKFLNVYFNLYII